ncbi:hypothetical protein JXB27_02480 [Candidatus Woesearchaeota archaeon]|nr:hypothetical protein [Candidatus Woesearchaeota archaeon]
MATPGILPETKKRKLEYFPLGTKGKRFAVKSFEKGQTKRKAGKVVEKKSEVISCTNKIMGQIHYHKLEDARKSSLKIIEALGDGLQNTIDVIQNECILFEEEFSTFIDFIGKQGEFMPKEELEELGKYLKVIQENVFVKFNHYINDLSALVDGKKPQIGAIYLLDKEYNVGIKSFWRWLPAWEWFHERGEAKKTFKEEKGILKIEGKNFEKMRADARDEQAYRLLKNYKDYFKDFKNLLTEMFEFKYLLILHATMAESFIEKGAAEYNIPHTFLGYSNEIQDLLDQEKGALKGIKESINYLYTLLGEARSKIGRAIAISEKQQKRLAA